MKRIACIALVLLALMTTAQAASNVDLFSPSNIGRRFEHLSVHPNGKELIFVEYTGGKETDDYRADIFEYNIDTKKYRKLVLPEGYLYSSPSFSPKGNFILLTRIPQFQNYDKKKKDYPIIEQQKSYSQTQILMLDANGMNLRILPIPLGRMDAPIMSPDEDKILYTVFTSPPREGHAVDWSKSEFVEFDLKTSANTLFAGPFGFISPQAIQYIDEDKVLILSMGFFGVDLSKYQKEYNSSQIMEMARSSKERPSPEFIDVTHGVHDASIDKNSNYYLLGYQYTKTGNNFFQLSPSGEKKSYPIPPGLLKNQLHSVSVTRDGKEIFFLYHADGTAIGDWKTAIGQFDIESSHWSTVAIPNIETGIPIVVH